MDEQLIMTIKDFRSLTGEATAHLSDDEVVESIKQLDFLAEMYIKQAIAGKENADKLESQE
ncbi:MAG TPA: hypothetical protein VGF75_00600 [Candidatus Saccharimonadales bacterium]|jgi:hypothetical protein